MTRDEQCQNAAHDMYSASELNWEDVCNIPTSKPTQHSIHSQPQEKETSHD